MGIINNFRGIPMMAVNPGEEESVAFSQVTFEDLLAEVRQYLTPHDMGAIQRAYNVAKQAHLGTIRRSGERDFQWMLNIRLSRTTYCPQMSLFRNIVGTLNRPHVMWSQVLANLRQQVFKSHLRKRNRLFFTWVHGHHWNTSEVIDNTHLTIV